MSVYKHYIWLCKSDVHANYCWHLAAHKLWNTVTFLHTALASKFGRWVYFTFAIIMAIYSRHLWQIWLNCNNFIASTVKGFIQVSVIINIKKDERSLLVSCALVGGHRCDHMVIHIFHHHYHCCCLYTSIFAVCMVSFFSARFRALGDVDKLIWCAKGTKVFYFPIPVFTGFWYLLVDDTLKDDIVNGITCKDCLCCHIHARWLQPPRQYSRCSGKTSLWQPIQYSFIHSSFCPPESLQYWYNVL